MHFVIYFNKKSYRITQSTLTIFIEAMVLNKIDLDIYGIFLYGNFLTCNQFRKSKIRLRNLLFVERASKVKTKRLKPIKIR